MTDPVSTIQAVSRPAPGRGWSTQAQLIAGALYVAVWIAGLAVWPNNLAIDASPAQVVITYRAGHGSAIAHYVLVEGIAGVLIAVVCLASAQRAAPHGVSSALRAVQNSRLGGGALVAALLAAAISVSQCILGMALVASAEVGRAERSRALFDVANRLDGSKMLLIAIASACLVASSHRRLPRWLEALSVCTALALAASGTSYLALFAGIAWLVYLSGPLLLIWVLGVGYWASRLSRE